MPIFELICVLTPAFAPNPEPAIKKITDQITKLGGEIKETRPIGEKALAYPIKRNSSGFYILFDVSLPLKEVGKLTASFSLMPEILRYLITKKPKQKIAMKAESAAPEVATKKVDIELGL